MQPVSTSPLNGESLVSIIVPSYNQGRFLRGTLDSIFEQDYRPLEVVVVDGASTDDTVPILEEYAAANPELRWVSEPDDGPAHAVNKGLEMIRGDIAAIQSSDDVYYPGAVRAAVEGFAENPGASIVYGERDLLDEAGNRIPARTRYPSFKLSRFLCISTFIPQSSAFFRPALAREVGGCRSGYYVFDTDLWLRMVFRAPAVKVAGIHSGCHVHDEQRDTRRATILMGHRRMLEESPEVQGAPWRIRRAAWAGGRVLAQFYNPTDSARYPVGQMFLAIITYPPSVLALRRPHLRGVIGRIRRYAARR